MKPEHVTELVQLRLKQAQETLVDARTLLEAGRTPRSVVNVPTTPCSTQSWPYCRPSAKQPQSTPES